MRMDRKQHFRVYRRFLAFELKERLIDLAMITGPIFVVTGIIAVSAKFWIVVLGL